MSDQADASTRLGSLLAETGMPATTAIGHRIVHGGRRCGSTAVSAMRCCSCCTSHRERTAIGGLQGDGFHSLSHRSFVRQLVRDLSQRLVVAYFGNGACVTAVKVGLLIDTSMGRVARTRAKYPCVLTNRRKAERWTTRQLSRADFLAWNVEFPASRSSCELRPPAWQTAWRPGANIH